MQPRSPRSSPRRACGRAARERPARRRRGSGRCPCSAPADSATTLMGAAPGGEPGEAWGYRQLPLSVGEVRVGTRELLLRRDAGRHPTRSSPSCATPTRPAGRSSTPPWTRAGSPTAGRTRQPALGADHPGAAAASWSAATSSRPGGEQLVVLHPRPGRQLAGARGAAARGLAAGRRRTDRPRASPTTRARARSRSPPSTRPAAPACSSARKGAPLADGIVHFDGSEWRKREPVEIPPGSETHFRILAIDATGLGNAWALAEADEDLGRSVVLLERTSTAGRAALGRAPAGGDARSPSRDIPGDGIAGAAPIGGAAQPLTVTADGAWIDLTADDRRRRPRRHPLLRPRRRRGDGLLVRRDALRRPALGVKLSRQVGYRSFAWPGGDFGTRVITNPLDPGGGEDSNRGTYLRFADGAFARMPGGGGNFRPSGAFASVDSGWLEGPVEISARPPPAGLAPWPVVAARPAHRRDRRPRAPPRARSAPAPSRSAPTARSLRYEPGRGWQREFLLSSSGSVNKATLRGVAWPEPSRAHAVGDLGAMWQWNAADDLWVADPGVPIGFEGNLMDVAFDPADPFARLRGRQGRRPARLRQELGPGSAAGRLRERQPDLDRLRRQPGDRRRGGRPARQRRRRLARRRLRPRHCSTRFAPAARSSSRSPACPTAAPSPPAATS